MSEPRPALTIPALRQPMDAVAVQKAARLRRLGQQSDEDVALGQQVVEAAFT